MTIEISMFWGDLADVSAKTKTLISALNLPKVLAKLYRSAAKCPAFFLEIAGWLQGLNVCSRANTGPICGLTLDLCSARSFHFCAI